MQGGHAFQFIPLKCITHIQPMHVFCSKRASSLSELRALEKHAFIATAQTEAIMMVEVDKLAVVLEGLQQAKLAATVAFLRDLPPVSNSSTNQVDSLFPDSIPSSSITPEELDGAYSITSIAPQLCKSGSKWGKQLAALEKQEEASQAQEPPLLRHCWHFIPSVLAHANTCNTQGCEGRGDIKGMGTQAHGIMGLQRTVRHVRVYDTHGR